LTLLRINPNTKPAVSLTPGEAIQQLPQQVHERWNANATVDESKQARILSLSAMLATDGQDR
jgi:hypothetical protein